jgi:phospholipase C
VSARLVKVAEGVVTMKYTLTTVLLFSCLAASAQAQISQFQHIIVLFQENRTPDNLFYALCESFSCSKHPTNSQYNIQKANWLDKTSPTGVTQPFGTTLTHGYGLGHGHTAFIRQCDLNKDDNPPQCRMDGAAFTSPNHGSFGYVLNTVDVNHPNGVLAPYLTLAAQYGWANYMFQTNQGPSYPAHQYIFAGTSALDAADDAAGTFIAGNINGVAGCYAQDGESFQLINAYGTVVQSGWRNMRQDRKGNKLRRASGMILRNCCQVEAGEYAKY